MGDKLAKSKNLCCQLVVFTRYSLLRLSNSSLKNIIQNICWNYLWYWTGTFSGLVQSVHTTTVYVFGHNWTFKDINACIIILKLSNSSLDMSVWKNIIRKICWNYLWNWTGTFSGLVHSVHTTTVYVLGHNWTFKDINAFVIISKLSNSSLDMSVLDISDLLFRMATFP